MGIWKLCLLCSCMTECKLGFFSYTISFVNYTQQLCIHKSSLRLLGVNGLVGSLFGTSPPSSSFHPQIKGEWSSTMADKDIDQRNIWKWFLFKYCIKASLVIRFMLLFFYFVGKHNIEPKYTCDCVHIIQQTNKEFRCWNNCIWQFKISPNHCNKWGAISARPECTFLPSTTNPLSNCIPLLHENKKTFPIGFETYRTSFAQYTTSALKIDRRSNMRISVIWQFATSL